MKDFLTWLSERGARTALGIYPPAYGAGNLPPLGRAAVSATNPISIATIHGNDPGQKELLSPAMKKEVEKNARKMPKLLTVNPWKDGFSKVEMNMPDPEKLWQTFLGTTSGQKYVDASLQEMMQLYRQDWKLKGTLNGDIHEALPKEMARIMMDILSFDVTQGAGGVDVARSGPRGGDVFQQTQATRDMLKKPYWQR